MGDTLGLFGLLDREVSILSLGRFGLERRVSRPEAAGNCEK